MRIHSMLPALALLMLSGCAAVGPGDSADPQKGASNPYALIQQGRYREAEALLTRDFDPATAPAEQLAGACSVYTFTKNYTKLFECLDLYQAKIERGEGTTGMEVDPYRMRATAYLDLGDYDRAIAQADRCMEVIQPLLHKMHFRAQMTWYAQFECLSAKGLAYVLKKDFPAARRTIQELLDIGEAGMQAEYRSLMLARIYLGMGEYKTGLEVLRRSVEEHSIIKNGLVKPAYTQFTEEIAEPGPLEGTMLNPIVMKVPQLYTVSKLLLESGETDLARRGLDKILTVPQVAQLGFLAWYIYDDRGRIAAMQGRDADAVRFYRQAIDVIESQRATIGNDAGKIGFVGDKQAVYGGMIRALMRLGRTADAFEYVERAKARALVDMLAARKDFAPASGSILQAQNLIQRLDDAERGAAAATSDIDAGGMRGVAMQIRHQIESLDPNLASLVSVEGTSASRISQGLGRDETLLEFYYQGDDLYAFVLTREGISATKLDSHDLERRVRAFRAALKDPFSNDYREHGQQLYTMLIAPIQNQLRTLDLVIVPHGILHYVPFAALQSSRDYLIDTYAISVLPSASAREFLHPHVAGVGVRSLLVLGNPDLGDPTYDLRFAESEARSIGELVPGATLLLRRDASERQFRALGPNFSAIHFATHGRFDAAHPLSSGLLLAGDRTDDGLLTVGELYGLRLRADLVTLSACETALGAIANGDDVVGLTRGFLFAGANTVVSSLWQVDDRATSLLMRDFYTNLGREDARDALRDAQLAVKGTNYLHPFYWAPFELAGSPD